MKKRILLSLSLTIVFSLFAWAATAQMTISGKITDKGKPVPFATVYIKNTTIWPCPRYGTATISHQIIRSKTFSVLIL